MRARQAQNPFSPMNIVIGTAGIFLGVIVGYVIGAAQMQPGIQVSAAAPDDHVHTTAAVADEGELQAYRNVLAGDPKNVRANIELANRLYDAGRYAEAIPFYQTAVSLETRDVNLSTDLGTALYYAGRTDEALAQLEKSMAIDSAHAQTLFNIGIVRRDGKRDRKGARAAWEQLLKVAPNYPEAERVRKLIAETPAAG